MPSVPMPNVLPVDCSGVVLEPKLDRAQQPNVAGLGVTNCRVKHTRIDSLNERLSVMN
jgi:hypothetical protein